MANASFTRRSIMSAMAVAPIAISAPAAAVVAPANADLIAQLDAVDDMSRRLEADPAATEAQWAEWDKRQSRIYEKVAALPATAENVPAKLRALKSIYRDEVIFGDAEDGSTDVMLSRQIVRALAG